MHINSVKVSLNGFAILFKILSAHCDKEYSVNCSLMHSEIRNTYFETVVREVSNMRSNGKFILDLELLDVWSCNNLRQFIVASVF